MEHIRASWWSVTINNPEQSDRQSLLKENWPSYVRSVKYQDEISSTGTPHIQMALNTSQIRQSSLKEWLPRAHFKVAKTKEHIEHLKNYVHKNETGVEGTRVDESREYLTQKQALLYIASVYEEPDLNCEPKLVKAKLSDAFWKAVRTLLYKNQDWVQVLTNPQVQRAWEHTHQVWIDVWKADQLTKITFSQPDSQSLPVSLDSPARSIQDADDDEIKMLRINIEDGLSSSSSDAEERTSASPSRHGS